MKTLVAQRRPWEPSAWMRIVIAAANTLLDGEDLQPSDYDPLVEPLLVSCSGVDRLDGNARDGQGRACERCEEFVPLTSEMWAVTVRLARRRDGLSLHLILGLCPNCAAAEVGP